MKVQTSETENASAEADPGRIRETETDGETVLYMTVKMTEVEVGDVEAGVVRGEEAKKGG